MIYKGDSKPGPGRKGKNWTSINPDTTKESVLNIPGSRGDLHEIDKLLDISAERILLRTHGQSS
jgi:hypothetical protein